MNDFEDGTLTLKVIDEFLKLNVLDQWSTHVRENDAIKLTLLTLSLGKAIKNKITTLPLEKVSNLSSEIIEENEDPRESEFLAMLEIIPSYVEPKLCEE